MKAITPTLPPGNRNKGFTLMELIVVMIIIAVMGAIVYPSLKKGMRSIRENKYKAKLEVLFKRALITSRFDGKAKVLKIDPDTGKIIEGKKSFEFFGAKALKFEKNGKETDTLVILPFSFYKASVIFEGITFSIDLYTGKAEIEENGEK